MNKVFAALSAVAFAFVFSLTAASPVFAGSTAACTDISASGNGDTTTQYGPFSVIAGAVINVTVVVPGGGGSMIGIGTDSSAFVLEGLESSPHTVSYTFTADYDNVLLVLGWQHPGTYSYSISCGSTPSELSPFTDGRINAYDAAAPVVVYPQTTDAGTGLVFYATDGTIVMTVSPQELAAAPDDPESPFIVAEANGVILSRIPGGQWQVNAPQYNGKVYIMIFDGPIADGNYTSYEIE